MPAKQKRKHRLLKWTLITGAAILIAAAVLYPYRFRLLQSFTDPDHNQYPIRGIDVSHHNGTIDWNAVAQQDIRFAYIKATEGTSFTDRKFITNARLARQAGIKVGAYHFFRFDKDGKRQADFFVKTFRKVHTDLPPVIDVEKHGNDTDVPQKDVIKRLKQMVERLQQYGYKPVIYSNQHGYSAYYQSSLKHIDLWLASITDPDIIRKSHKHTIQQYNQWGYLKGIKGHVDLNCFIGSETEWNQWLSNKVGSINCSSRVGGTFRDDFGSTPRHSSGLQVKKLKQKKPESDPTRPKPLNSFSEFTEPTISNTPQP